MLWNAPLPTFVVAVLMGMHDCFADACSIMSMFNVARCVLHAAERSRMVGASPSVEIIVYV
jgi:hypothetical protein